MLSLKRSLFGPCQTMIRMISKYRKNEMTERMLPPPLPLLLPQLMLLMLPLGVRPGKEAYAEVDEV